MADYSWHAHETGDALRRLESDRSGLSDEEAGRRLEQVGPNRLMRSPPVSAWKILGDQLTSVVVGLLAAAGGVSLVLADYTEAAAIGAVLGLNTPSGSSPNSAPDARWRRSCTSTCRGPWCCEAGASAGRGSRHCSRGHHRVEAGHAVPPTPGS